MVLTRNTFVRGLGAIYLIAFLSLEWQVTGLLGADGLRPAADFLARAREALGGIDPLRLPTVFWLDASDAWLRGGCWLGAALALLVIGGMLPLASLLGCWILYLSYVGIGAPFLSYQWDALLLETGFLGILWAPASARLASPRATEPTRAIRWLLWWLVFRLMFFSGWVKLASGDPTWWDLSALEYHYETQPLPTWTAWYAHQLPSWFQRLSVFGTFVIELVVPFGILLGRRGRAVVFVAFLGLQAFIGATGNYGFFNLLSALLCVPLLDDDQILAVVPAALRRRTQRSSRPAGRLRSGLDPIVVFTLLAATVPASIAQLTGIRAPYDLVAPAVRALQPFHLTSRYGLFAVMTTNRPEVVIEGSDDGVTWTAYSFRWKPGPLDRRPTFVEPDMPRLDWQMWFDALYIERALRTGQRAQRVITPSVVAKLREGSTSIGPLLGANPFPEAPPRYLRWQLYDYEFTDASERATTGNWWTRQRMIAD